MRIFLIDLITILSGKINVFGVMNDEQCNTNISFIII